MATTAELERRVAALERSASVLSPAAIIAAGSLLIRIWQALAEEG